MNGKRRKPKRGDYKAVNKRGGGGTLAEDWDPLDVEESQPEDEGEEPERRKKLKVGSSQRGLGNEVMNMDHISDMVLGMINKNVRGCWLTYCLENKLEERF